MAISLLKIENLRNIRDLTLHPYPYLNMIWGDNGSGKTTILEAIYTIARGRSFRGRGAGSLISRGEQSLTVFSMIESAGQRNQVGVRKTSRETEVRHNGQSVNKLSALAQLTPLQIITPNSHELLERGPEYRRRFLEWGVFHVEHEYKKCHREYIKALLNRNAALRDGRSQLSTWDKTLGDYGERLEKMRNSYFNLFKEVAVEEIKLFLPNIPVELIWKKGWKEKESLIESLSKSREKDIERGFTQIGPHRADLSIKFTGRSAKNSASRGQQKLIIIAMHLAQATISQRANNISPIILIDDLAAELDSKNRVLLLNRLSELKSQVFLTGTDPITTDGLKLFHVEHGTIR
ncbi:MAG: DNA replication/repair protein RecF [Sedimenticola sp.]